MRVYNDSAKSRGIIRTVARRARATYRFGLVAPPEVGAREAYRSMVYSAYDDVPPSERLIAVALQAAERARGAGLDSLAAREPGPVKLATLWPGEHYRLLSGLVAALGARRVVEIGTGTGLSALAMLSAMPADGRLVTFDIVPWREYPDVLLREEDFTDRRLEQRVADLTDHGAAEAHIDVIEQADLIFVDAQKDGEQEWRFLALFDAASFERAPLVVFDDVRLWTMLQIWRSVRRPKLDLTSLGHWSGTGLIDYA